MATTDFIPFNARKSLSMDLRRPPTAQFYLCQLLFCFISNEEKTLEAKFDFEKVKDFNPLRLFQRIDRAGKSSITRQDLQAFFKDNGYHNVDKLNLVVKPKLTYQQFLKLILDKGHKAQYFNQRLSDQDHVVRKIDRLSPSLELGLCKLIFV